MAVVDMKKVTVAGLEKDKSFIVDELMKIGTVDISDASFLKEELDGMVIRHNYEEGISDLKMKADGIQAALSHLGRMDKRKKGIFSPRKSIDEKRLEEVKRDEERLLTVAGKVNNAEGEIKALFGVIADRQSFIKTLEPWRSLDVPLEKKSTAKAHIFLGTLSKGRVDPLELFKGETVSGEVYCEVVNENEYMYFVFLACHKSDREELTAVLRQLDFNFWDLDNLTGTPAHNINRIKEEIGGIKRQIEQIEESLKDTLKDIESLEILYDCLIIEGEKQDVLGRVMHTDRTFIIEGWLPVSALDTFKEKTVELSQMCYINIGEPAEGEEYPILLENHRLVKPFELITELYSLPKPGELDPNMFMAPFFFIFFGMMLSDGGYGILVSVLCFLALKKLKPEGMAEKLLKLLFYGGISAIIWGALFGGWFGDVISQLTGGKFQIKPLWFNPLDDPMKLLIWSFGFGVLQLFTAMGVTAYDKARKGFILDAILDTIFWYIFIIGLLLLLGGETFSPISKYMAIGGAAGLVLTQGRKEKGIFKKLIKGISSLNNVVSYMSDVLSYSRLLALGLATGVVASVINTIGLIFGFNPLGIIIFIVMFVIGHVFNLLINALGAFVHASRLQYVEFYGKFYEGGGKAYMPFKINTKYINIKDNRKGLSL